MDQMKRIGREMEKRELRLDTAEGALAASGWWIRSCCRSVYGKKRFAGERPSSVTTAKRSCLLREQAKN
jgi:hypothetical protein